MQTQRVRDCDTTFKACTSSSQTKSLREKGVDPLPIKEMVQDIHSAEPNPTVSESEEAKWLTVSNLKDAFVCSLVENKSHPSLPLDGQTLAKSCSTVL